jgi:hypothetical protein
MRVVDKGSIIMFVPECESEYEWLLINTDHEHYQWVVNKLVVDRRMSYNIIECIISDGFHVTYHT